MSMSMSRRLQILVDDERFRRLERVAKHRGTSVAQVVRDAIDFILTPEELEERSAAVRRLLDAPDMPVDDWPVMKREIETMYERE